MNAGSPGAGAAEDWPKVYDDAGFYDWLAEYTAPNDLPLYRRLCTEWPGEVLEIACGTGRVCLALAEQGVRVSGLDRAAALIEQAARKARQRGLAVRLVEADMRAFDLAAEFALILVPYNAFNHLYGYDDQCAALACLRQHMSADTRLVIDTFNPDPRALLADGSREQQLFRLPAPWGGASLRLMEIARYDRVPQIYHSRWRFCDDQGGVWREDRLRMRVFFPAELETLLRSQGLEVETRWGDYAGRPFQADSPKQLLLCRRR